MFSFAFKITVLTTTEQVKEIVLSLHNADDSSHPQADRAYPECTDINPNPATGRI
jgi:hypothetical protein